MREARVTEMSRDSDEKKRLYHGKDPGEMTQQEKIRANARLVVEGLGPAATDIEDFGLNRESVEWVDGYIERQRKRGGSKAEIESLVQVIGSFVGEAIIKTYGGKWGEFEGNLGIFFREAKKEMEEEPEDITMTDEELMAEEHNLHAVFPFAKVHKQFQQGRKNGESVFAFFELIGQMQKKPKVKRFH
jgi:hypothetical protein